MTITRLPPATSATTAPRRAGYVAAAAVNVLFLWFVNQLPEWHWPAFLTPAFENLLPYINVSLLATIAANVLWTWRDPEWFHRLAQIGLNLVAILSAVRTWQIFPFDFTAYGGPWEAVARLLIAIGVFGLVVGTITEAVRLARSAAVNRTRSPRHHHRSAPPGTAPDLDVG